MSNEGTIIDIQLLSNDSSLGDAHIRVPEGQIARDAIQAAYATLTADQMKRLVVCMAGDEIDMESSFEANGIEDGARLEVSLLRKASLEEVVRDMVELNPHRTVEELMGRVRFEEDGCTLQSWGLSRTPLTVLPESIGDLTLSGNLILGMNRL